MNERIEYWLDLADYDLKTAKAMLKTKRYLYVGFMCHQVIEKGIKAVIAKDCEDDEIPPKIHNLSKLAIRAKIFESMSEEQQDFIEDMNPLNIEARYPEYKQQLMNMLTKDKCKEIFIKTEKFLCWIKEQL